MKIKVVECVEWKAPDKPGELLGFATAFASKGVDLDILWSCGEAGLLGACAKKPAKLAAALKALGVKASASKCFYLTGKDKAGALVKALKKLTSAGVNVDGCTALASKGRFGAMLWVKDVEKARKALKV